MDKRQCTLNDNAMAMPREALGDPSLGDQLTRKRRAKRKALSREQRSHRKCKASPSAKLMLAVNGKARAPPKRSCARPRPGRPDATVLLTAPAPGHRTHRIAATVACAPLQSATHIDLQHAARTYHMRHSGQPARTYRRRRHMTQHVRMFSQRR
jgi:hypothetical protein